MAFDHRPIYLQCAMKYALWSGDTAPTQFMGPINITKLETTPIKQEDDELLSNIDGSVGELLGSVPKPSESASLSMEFNSMPKELLALVLGADLTTFSQTATPVVDATIDTALNVFVTVAANKPYIDANQTITLKTAADATIDPSKYEVDHISGMIMATHADAVGTGMKLSYTPLAITNGEKYAAGKAKSANLMLLGSATEKYSGRRGRLIIHKASVKNEAAYDWVKGGWAVGSLPGKLITPPGASSPTEFYYLPAAA